MPKDMQNKQVTLPLYAWKALLKQAFGSDALDHYHKKMQYRDGSLLGDIVHQLYVGAWHVDGAPADLGSGS